MEECLQAYVLACAYRCFLRSRYLFARSVFDVFFSISFFNWPYLSFLWHFGANTMWIAIYTLNVRRSHFSETLLKISMIFLEMRFSSYFLLYCGVFFMLGFFLLPGNRDVFPHLTSPQSRPPVEPVACTAPIRGYYRLNSWKGDWRIIVSYRITCTASRKRVMYAFVGISSYFNASFFIEINFQTVSYISRLA